MKIIAGLIWSVLVLVPYTLGAVCFLLSIFTDPFGWSAVRWYSKYLEIFVRFIVDSMERKFR